MQEDFKKAISPPKKSEVTSNKQCGHLGRARVMVSETE